MQISILKKEDFKESRWAGGLTTQLYIYPHQAVYADLNFKLRISTAKVALERSDFSSLPQVHRRLMILEGGINIRHKGRYEKRMELFDTDEFEGDWETSSEGKCTDFNVMSREGTETSMKHESMEKNESRDWALAADSDVLSLYLVSGTLTLDNNTQKYELKAGEMLLIEEPIGAEFRLTAQEKVHFIETKATF